MSEIVNKVEQIVIDRSNKFYEKTKGTVNEYNLYEDHVKHVFSYARMMGSTKNLDMEVLLLSALLHDISMCDGKIKGHNEYSAVIAREILEQFQEFPKEKIDHVCKCILNHSNSRRGYRTTKEEMVLVDCDSLSHFVCIDKLYNLFHNVQGNDDMESLRLIKDKLYNDYDEMSDYVQKLVVNKYNEVMNASSIDDIIDRKVR